VLATQSPTHPPDQLLGKLVGSPSRGHVIAAAMLESCWLQSKLLVLWP